MMAIEKLSNVHINFILPVENDCYSDPWNYSHFLYEAHNPHSKSFVSISNIGYLEGYIIAHHIIDNMYILNLAVNKQNRRSGIAIKLLHHLFNIAKNEKVSKIDLEVRKSNVSALSLYRKEQFKIAGERKKFYSDGEDAIIMYREID